MVQIVGLLYKVIPAALNGRNFLAVWMRCLWVWISFLGAGIGTSLVCVWNVNGFFARRNTNILVIISYIFLDNALIMDKISSCAWDFNNQWSIHNLKTQIKLLKYPLKIGLMVSDLYSECM